MTAHAEEIKLHCNVTHKYNKSGGQIERDTGTAIIDIDTSPPLEIIVKSTLNVYRSNLFSTSIRDTPHERFKVTNNSNASKWDVIVGSINDKENYSYVDNIVIDRNVGSVSIRRIIQTEKDSLIITEVSGTCSKVDTSKKKF